MTFQLIEHGVLYEREFERRYHSTWARKNGRSALSQLGSWMTDARDEEEGSTTPIARRAPSTLLIAAREDVRARLPTVAAREPTRRHRKHFAWLLRWLDIINTALARRFGAEV